jgi:phytoene dehydrogenase-like protein
MCANRLADAGFDVTVFESSEHAGGGVSSGEDTIPGFVHDRCAGFFPLTAASPAFRGLKLERHGLQWVTPSVAMAHPFLDGSVIALHRSLEETVSGLDVACPGAGAAWHALAVTLLREQRDVCETALHTFPPVLPALRLTLRLRRQILEIARLLISSAASVGRELFGDPAPTAWLCGSLAHSDLSPGAAGGAAFALVLNWLGHVVGWPLPQGGAGQLSTAMVGRLEAAGGIVRCNATVQAIVSQGGRVRAIRLATGEEIEIGVVVAAISARPLAGMLSADALPSRIMRRLEGWRYGLGTFKLDWALSEPVAWTAQLARQAGVVHVGDTVDAFFEAFHAAGAGRLPRTPALVVGQQSLHDPSRARSGGHTLYAYSRLPVTLTDDDAVIDRIEQRIEAFAPGFRDTILARRHMSPRMFEAANPSMVGGDLAGGSLELDQQLIFRPGPELVRHRTPLRGLYVASASVHPGAGVHGVPGAGAAAAVVADHHLFGRALLGARTLSGTLLLPD